MFEIQIDRVARDERWNEEIDSICNLIIYYPKSIDSEKGQRTSIMNKINELINKDWNIN